MSEERNYDEVKDAVLEYIQSIFEEMEAEMALSHQEKYALLEDALGNATDLDELRVAFEQWYTDHSEDIEFEHDAKELWEQAVAQVVE